MKEAPETHQVDIWLEYDNSLLGKGYQAAIVTYTPDGKGNSGQEENSKVWEVAVSEQNLSTKQIEIAKAWDNNREAFIEDGIVNEDKLKPFLAKKLKKPIDKITLPFVIRKAFDYKGGSAYEIVGSKSSDSIENPESFSISACQQDLQCWGDKHSIFGGSICKPYIEKLAKYDFEWTDGWLGSKFTHFRWKDKKKGIITFIGDKIKLQNGFGAWQRYTYECDYLPNKNADEYGTVLDIRASEGRL